MKHKESIIPLVIIIVAFSALATVCGIWTGRGIGEFTFKSLFGRTITIFGSGMYSSNSTSTALQAKSQDMVTLFIAIPLLIYSLMRARKNYIIGRILLSGTLGYFFITYFTYTFHLMYSRLFLIYILLMSTSAFAFGLSLMTFNTKKTGVYFKRKFPVRWVGGYLIFYSAVKAYMWLSIIIPSTLFGRVPQEVEQGTTLAVQAIDMAFVLPVLLLSGVLLIRRKPLGYILSPVMTVIVALSMGALFLQQVMLTLGGDMKSVPLILFGGVFGILSLISINMSFKYVAELKHSSERLKMREEEQAEE